MTDIRRGGRASAPASTSGGDVLWSVAQGRRGTRWREITTLGSGGAGAALSLMVEESPIGRIARLEVATLSGLLTLHPAEDASALHGNVVTPTGIRHVNLPWSDAHVLMVDGSSATAAIVAHRLGGHLAIGDEMGIEGVIVGDELDSIPAVWSVERSAERTWRFRPAATGHRSGDAISGFALEIDDVGLPVRNGGESWALET